MHLKLIVPCFLGILLCVFCVSTAAQAKETEDIETITIEKAIELALNNHGNIKLLETKIKALSSQHKNIQDELKELDNIHNPTISLLPTNPEYFLHQHPDFNQLAEEEKEAIGQLIGTQILINTTLNQLLEGQEVIRNQELQEKIKVQREELNNAAKVIDANQSKNYIGIEKTREAIKQYISQKYISLLLLDAEIKQLKKELSYIHSDIEDLWIMAEHGLTSNKDVEKKEREIKKLNQQLDEKVRAFHFYLEELKLEVGLPYNRMLQLQSIDKEINRLPIMELESKMYKMFNVRELEEDILLAEKNYTSAESSKTNLKDYYYQTWQVAKYEKDNLVKELKVKIKKFYFEQEEMFLQMNNLQETKASLIADKKDLQIQYSAGVITSAELERIDRDIQRIESEINIYKFNYYILSEKYTQALNGYFM
ncbi:hypothetical protein [Lysinibacillus fusiformis]|uniref:TolC family protein n=1 Tax=Lysinibacillus fusiformis TaxID=28031 RepID=A0A1H9FER2_9BACI|nr:MULTISPECIES: hypothetical protein [Lysinibacillus]MED4669378.1 hypothetical protein [Lysinibacillus fusiformis]NOG29760.1 hypothetical protein [Lysinibacillus fusiformis]QAS57869.1 hypothetical protein LSP_16790 [Lysinibacillus sphaericus]RDV34227.1 hypothetical protein C7B90_05580 [Lysinibacillus fusiformis]SCY21719.1 hypothetical protein SAMN02787081_01620 [Lysinibacillus fusiformis]